MDGAEGAAKIAALTQSYINTPPTEMDGTAVAGMRDFSAGKLIDVEGLPIPAEKMLFIELVDGRSFFFSIIASKSTLSIAVKLNSSFN